MIARGAFRRASLPASRRSSLVAKMSWGSAPDGDGLGELGSAMGFSFLGAWPPGMCW
jgi:hypothetical protein